LVEQGLLSKTHSLQIIQESQEMERLQKTIKTTKHISFNKKIQEIILKNQRLWDLMNWVKKYKLLAIEAIQYNRQPYIDIEDLWYALY